MPQVFTPDNRTSELETLLRDHRYGARVLVKKPGFTAMVLIALSLTIGANIANRWFRSIVAQKPQPQTVKEYECELRSVS